MTIKRDPSGRLLKVIDWAFILAGTAAVAYGVWLILVIVSKGV